MREDQYGKRTNGRDGAPPGPVRAFTLIEILIVMAILVLLAGISWPALEGQISAAQLPESAARVRDLCYMARVEATKEYRRVRIRFVPGEQQPRIEIERDPILYPDEWQPIESPWAEQAMDGLLLSNVEVHSISLGRPEWTKPLSLNESPDPNAEDKDKKASLNNDGVDALDSGEVPESFDATEAKSNRDANGEPLDEDRPIIEFAANGSSDWALLVLAQRPPVEELEDEDPVQWVLLDGRSGLARIQSPLTDDDLVDDQNYVIRENLYPPDLTDLGRLTLTSTGFGGQPATDEDGDGVPDAPLTDEFGDAAAGLGSDLGSDLGGDIGKGAEGTDLPATPSDLEDLLNSSDLTESERENIRNAMNGGGGGNHGGGNHGGGNRGGGNSGGGNHGGGNSGGGNHGGGRNDVGGAKEDQGRRPGGRRGG